jgi:hypothetical protein
MKLETIFEQVQTWDGKDIIVPADDFESLIQYVPHSEVGFEDNGRCLIRWGGRQSRIILRPDDEARFRATKVLRIVE